MTDILTAVVSAADFERGRRVISGLADYDSYDHWLDIRYGRVMGLSLGGAHADLESVALDDFMNWCRDCGIHPSEAALDDFAQLGRLGSVPAQAQWSGLPSQAMLSGLHDPSSSEGTGLSG